MERLPSIVVVAVLAALIDGGCSAPLPALTPDDDIATLVTASWIGDPVERTRVEVDGPDGPFLVSDWQAPEADAVVPLLGLLPATDWTARVVTESGGASPDVPLVTLEIPASLPAYSVTGTAGWEGYLVTSLMSTRDYVVILDPSGKIVWYRGVTGRRHVFRSRLVPDGSGVRFAEVSDGVAGGAGSADLLTVAWDGHQTADVVVDAYSHDFVDAPDGRLACIAMVPDPATSDPSLLGDSLVLVDGEGNREELWSAWDTLTPPDEPWLLDEWSHANAVDYDADRGSYWLGMRNLDEIAEVLPDGRFGERIGGEASDWTFPEGEAPKWQHQFEKLDDGILVFDDRAGGHSRAVEYRFDQDTGAATPVWEYRHDPDLWVFALGDVDRGADGSTLVTFSTAGVIDDVAADGELRWELAGDLGVAVGYGVRVEGLPGVERVGD